MSKTESKGRAQYEKAREAFTKLDMQDKAAFVMEATFSTFGEAFKAAGQQFAEVFEKVTADDFFSGFAWESGDESTEEEATDKKPSNGRKKSGSHVKEEKGRGCRLSPTNNWKAGPTGFRNADLVGRAQLLGGSAVRLTANAIDSVAQARSTDCSRRGKGISRRTGSKCLGGERD